MRGGKLRKPNEVCYDCRDRNLFLLGGRRCMVVVWHSKALRMDRWGHLSGVGVFFPALHKYIWTGDQVGRFCLTTRWYAAVSALN